MHKKCERHKVTENFGLVLCMCVPVYLRFGRCEGHAASFWSGGMNATVWATLPNRAQVHRWAGSLVDNLNFHISMEGFSQTPLWRLDSKGVLTHCRRQKKERTMHECQVFPVEDLIKAESFHSKFFITSACYWWIGWLTWGGKACLILVHSVWLGVSWVKNWTRRGESWSQTEMIVSTRLCTARTRTCKLKHNTKKS